MSTPEVNLKNSLLVYNPPEKCIYHYGPLNISFSREMDCSWVDFSTLRLGIRGDDSLHHSFHFSSFIMIPPESLPFDKKFENLGPLLGYFFKRPGKLMQITSLMLHIEPDKYKTSLKLATRVQIINRSLQIECQQELGRIPVYTGGYPIFYDNQRPSASAIFKIFKEFVTYNTPEKLKYQREKSAGLCHIRAEVISKLLDAYHITTTKVLKFWNSSDWDSYEADHPPWGFHAAAMITDSKNRHWVWDPWFGSNQELLPLKKWVKRSDEPKPKSLLITNKIVIADIKAGQIADASYFMQLGPKIAINAFRAICMDAIPNPPERPISLTVPVKKVSYSTPSSEATAANNPKVDKQKLPEPIEEATTSLAPKRNNSVTGIFSQVARQFSGFFRLFQK